MSAVIATFLHSVAEVYRFGIRADEDYLWISRVGHRPTREKIVERDEDNGQEIYVGYVYPSIAFPISAVQRKWAGFGNMHPGQSVSLGEINVLNTDSTFGFDISQGRVIYEEATRTELPGQLHELEYTLRLLFPEGLNAGPSGAATLPDNPGDDVIVIEEPAGGGTPNEDGQEDLQTYRIFYGFTPARGYDASPATGHVTRLVSSAATLTEEQLYSYHNPPAEEWTTPYGPSWNVNDLTAVRGSSIPGTYSIAAIYHLETNSFLVGSDASYQKYESASHGTDVIGVVLNNGERRLLTGDFPDLASVLTYLSLGDASTLAQVYSAKARTNYHLGANPGTDPVAPWRISAPQPVAAEFVQFYHMIGHRRTGVAWQYVAVSSTKFLTSGGAAGGPVDSIPLIPPQTHFNSALNLSPFDDYTTVYCGNTLTDDIGNGTTDRLGKTVGGPDLWVFQYGPNVVGGIANVWDWRTGDAQTIGEFWEILTGSYVENPNLANYAVVVRLTAPGGPHYYKGSISNGDPVAQTTGLLAF